MNRSEIRESLRRVNDLAVEVERHVPADRPEMNEFRSDIAGLLVVLTCATYETCVKQVILNYANSHNPIFGSYAENKYQKINSKIDISDLKNYSKIFHPDVGELFKLSLENYRLKFLKKTNSDITASYIQLLKWRHSFAHTGNRVTTVEEVLRHHGLAKRVLFVFADSFTSFAPKPKAI